MQLEVLVTPQAVDLFRLDNLGRQTVAVADALRTGAGLDEFGTNSQLAQISLLFQRISLQDSEKLVHGSLRESFDVIVSSKNGAESLAKAALYLLLVVVFFLQIMPLNDNIEACIENISSVATRDLLVFFDLFANKNLCFRVNPDIADVVGLRHNKIVIKLF